MADKDVLHQLPPVVIEAETESGNGKIQSELRKRFIALAWIFVNRRKVEIFSTRP